MRSWYYDELARHLPGNIHNASALSNDSKNILDIIRENYRVFQLIHNDFYPNDVMQFHVKTLLIYVPFLNYVCMNYDYIAP